MVLPSSLDGPLREHLAALHRLVRPGTPPWRTGHLAADGAARQVSRHQPELRLAVCVSGYDIRTVQELLGHSNVKITMIYTHVMGKGARGVIGPLDRGMSPATR